MKAIILLLFLLTGCSGFGPDGNPTSQRVASLGGEADVKEIRLSDGTRCAVLVGLYKGAISCDWQSQR